MNIWSQSIEDSIHRGKNYLIGVMSIIVLLQIITNIMDDAPLLFSLTRMSIIFVLFNFLSKGFSFSKWLLTVYLVFVGIGGLWIGSYLFLNRNLLENNLSIGIISLIIGMAYVLTLITIHFSKDIRSFLVHQKGSCVKNNFKNHIANILLYIGIAVIICVEVEMLPMAFSRVIENPQITKRIIGLIFLLPVKIPYYAIPGIILIAMSRFLSDENNKE